MEVLERLKIPQIALNAGFGLRLVVCLFMGGFPCAASSAEVDYAWASVDWTGCRRLRFITLLLTAAYLGAAGGRCATVRGRILVD